MAVNKQLKDAIAHIKFRFGLNQAEIADRLEVKSTYLSDMINGRVPFTDNISNKLYELFHITAEENTITNEDVGYKLPTNINGEGVPYFEDIESSGGIIPAMNENGKEIPTFFINYEHFNDCTAYLQHVGDSMYPKYCAGEIIAVKRIYNFDVVLWGEAYLIVTNDNANSLRTVKLLFQHDEQSKIILRASNPNYKGDTVINKVDILSMFIVKGKITRNQL